MESAPRPAPRQGHSIAVFALVRKRAVPVYRMLRYGEDSVDIGEQACEKRFRVQRVTGPSAAVRSPGFQLVRQAPAPARHLA